MGFQFKNNTETNQEKEVIEPRLSPVLLEKIERREQEEKIDELSYIDQQLQSMIDAVSERGATDVEVEINGKLDTFLAENVLSFKRTAFRKAMPYFKLISNSSLRNYVMAMWLHAPDYFFVIGASSTGKYHAPWSTSPGGLVRHVLMGMQVAYDLSATFGLSDNERDMAVAAMAGHDLLKYGIEYDKNYQEMHPFLPRYYYGHRKSKARLDLKQYGISEETFDTIMKAIERHMGNLKDGSWTSVGGIKPETDLEKVVHLADYMASRKKILMDDFIEFM